MICPIRLVCIGRTSVVQLTELEALAIARLYGTVVHYKRPPWLGNDAM
jgi:hypothetical protein